MKCGGCTVDDDAVAEGGETGALLLDREHRELPAIICPPRRTGRRTKSESGDCERRSLCGSPPAPAVPGDGIGGSEGNFAYCYKGSHSQRSSLVEPRWSSFKETSVHMRGRANGGASIVLQPEVAVPVPSLTSTTKVIGKEVRVARARSAGQDGLVVASDLLHGDSR